MDIAVSTREYEAWLGGFMPLYLPDLEHKHRQMAAADPFPFFRGTYYRWAQHWAATAGDLASAPPVLAIGDLHVENFGTWRDADGRLCWGLNDFDEVDHLPYTHDLVRLAASVRFARKAGTLDVKSDVACDAILEGYRDAVAAAGKPFVLEEKHPKLRAMAMAAERDPIRFWEKLTGLLADPAAEPPAEAKEALMRLLPVEGLSVHFRRRPGAGMGSLGRPRYVALAEWNGGWVAREAKSLAPPATSWAAGQGGRGSMITEAVSHAIRCPDPTYRVESNWIIRRLAPRCSRIDLAHLKHAGDLDRLLHAMGAETANIHLGTKNVRPAIQADLTRRPSGWLHNAARELAKLIEQDWTQWQKAGR